MDKQSREMITWVSRELDRVLDNNKDNIPYSVWLQLREILNPLDEVVRKLYMDSK